MKNIDLCKKQNQSLNLSCSSLKCIPIDKKHEKIVRLDISHNHLQTLENIEQFKMLGELTLSHNRIGSWNQLLRIKNKERLRCLNVRNNPLEMEPNYKYKVMRQFTKLERMDEVQFPSDYVKTLIEVESIVEQRVVEWMAKMVTIDRTLEAYQGNKQSATQLSTMAPTRAQTTRHCPPNIMLFRQLLQSLTFVLDQQPSHPLLTNSLKIVKILSYQIPISPDPSTLQSIEISFFRELLIQISSRTDSFMSYLLNQMETQYDISQDILKNNTELSTKILWSQFKRLYGRDVGKSTQISSVQTDDIIRPIFPYLACEQYYVDSLLKIMEDMLVETRERLANVLKSEHQTETIKISQNYEKIKQLQYPQYLSKQSEDESQPSRVVENIPTPLVITVINMFNSYSLKYAFKNIYLASKHQTLRNLYLLLGVKATVSLRCGFQSLKAIHIGHQSLEQYHRLAVYRRVFRRLLRVVQSRHLRMLKLRRIVNRKVRIEGTLKHFAFSRWKMMSSKTLKYIGSIKSTKGMSKREILAQYDKLKRTGY